VAFVALLAVGLAGVLIAFRAAAVDSADPVIRKQALAIAESMLEEVQQMPFTYCDPDDAAVTTADGPTDCAVPQDFGPTGGETRYSTTTPFDNVQDYAGYTTSTEAPSG